MSRTGSRRGPRPAEAPAPPRAAAIYVEGAGDRAILEGWARVVSPRLERAVRAGSVILGGRQPDRAQRHLARLRQETPGARGLCILDRDGTTGERPRGAEDLEIFVWSRRHIESYLLVPEAIRRGLRRRDHDGALRRFVASHVPEDDRGYERLHAKRLLGPRGPIAEAVGRPLPLGRIARGMRVEELHSEVQELLGRVSAVLGHAPPAPVVTLRRPDIGSD